MTRERPIPGERARRAASGGRSGASPAVAARKSFAAEPVALAHACRCGPAAALDRRDVAPIAGRHARIKGVSPSARFGWAQAGVGDWRRWSLGVTEHTTATISPGAARHDDDGRMPEVADGIVARAVSLDFPIR